MKRVYIISASALLCLHFAKAQVSVIPTEHIDSLIDLTYSDSLYYFQKLASAEKALTYAKATDYKNGIFLANMATGICHLNLNNYDKTVKYFQDARLIAEDLDSLGYKAYSEYFLGNVYNRLEDTNQALKHFNNSLKFYVIRGTKDWIGVVKNGIGIIEMKSDNHEKALATLKESLKIFEDLGMEAETGIPINNIGEYYFQQGQFELALKYYQRAYELSRKNKDAKGEALGLANIGLTLAELNQFDEAIQSVKKGIQIAKENQFKEEIYLLYKDLADTYEKMGDTGKSLEYLQIYSELKDSVINQNVKDKISELQISFETVHRERELKEKETEIAALKQEKKISQLMNILTVGGLLLSLAILYLFFSRNKAKRKLTESELKNKALETDQLKKELEFKNKDLTNFALDISRKNEFTQKLHDRLEELANSRPTEIKDKARKLLLMMNNHLKINEDFAEFQMNIEQVNRKFFSKLETEFPELTVNEKQLCGLIRLNLSTKDIASIKNISPKSVEMGRYRLRKKLKLEAQEEISAFLQRL